MDKKNKKLLKLLKDFLAQIPASCQIYLFGGIAVDGYYGALTRKHDDLDFICWRKDVKTVQRIIKTMGYELETSPHPKDPKRICSFVSADKEHLITFQIIEEMSNNTFEINFWHFPYQVLAQQLLGPVYLTLEQVTFPAVSKKLLAVFQQNAGKYFKKIKTINPKLYNRLGYKLDNYAHDFALMKSAVIKKNIKHSILIKTDLDKSLAELAAKSSHRVLGRWARDCTKRVLPYFAEKYPKDERPQKALTVLQTWIKTGKFSMAVIRKASLDAHAAARSVKAQDLAARGAARAAGQAVATAHVPTHSLAAALYAAASLRDATGSYEKALEERKWQYQHLQKLNKKFMKIY